MPDWLIQNLQPLRLPLQRFIRAPLGNLLAILVMAIALSLPAGLYLLAVNLNTLANGFAADPQISVFLKTDASPDETAQLRRLLAHDPQVASYTFIPKAAALTEMAQAAGVQDLAAGLPQNPLPDAFTVRGRDPAPAALDALRQQISQWPAVALCQFDAQWARRLDAIFKLGRELAMLLGLFLSVALVAIVSNTIRLQMLTSQAEIEVSSLIGATPRLIRRPFLYFGALQGFTAGLVSLLLVGGSVYLLNQAIGHLAALYDSHYQLRQLPAMDQAYLVVFAAGLGWLGAYLAVDQSLRQMQVGH